MLLEHLLKTVYSSTVPAHEISIPVMYTISLDSVYLHNASHLHVEVNAVSAYQFH